MSDELPLREKQSLFAILVSRLIQEAYKRGYEITLGEAWRSEAEAERRGFKNSLHRKRLAIDLNLFRDGVYLKNSEDHKPLGQWWEAQHELCRWGGRFGDGNHYSVTHGGVQ